MSFSKLFGKVFQRTPKPMHQQNPRFDTWETAKEIILHYWPSKPNQPATCNMVTPSKFILNPACSPEEEESWNYIYLNSFLQLCSYYKLPSNIKGEVEIRFQVFDTMVTFVFRYLPALSQKNSVPRSNDNDNDNILNYLETNYNNIVCAMLWQTIFEPTLNIQQYPDEILKDLPIEKIKTLLQSGTIQHDTQARTMKIIFSESIVIPHYHVLIPNIFRASDSWILANVFYDDEYPLPILEIFANCHIFNNRQQHQQVSHVQAQFLINSIHSLSNEIANIFAAGHHRWSLKNWVSELPNPEQYFNDRKNKLKEICGYNFTSIVNPPSTWTTVNDPAYFTPSHSIMTLNTTSSETSIHSQHSIVDDKQDTLSKNSLQWDIQSSTTDLISPYTNVTQLTYHSDFSSNFSSDSDSDYEI